MSTWESGPRVVVAAALAAMGITSTSVTAHAFVVKQAAGGESVRWGASQVTFVVDPSVDQWVPHGGDAVSGAVGAWSGTSSAPVLETVMGPAGGTATVDGTNTILLAPPGFPFPGNALAITLLSYDQNTGLIVDADIVINGSHPFKVFPADARAPKGAAPVSTEGGQHGERAEGEFDIQHVVAHEVGHALGLGDNEGDGTALMYAYTKPNDASLRGPASDDANGLETIYGGQKGSAGCGQSNVAGTRPRAPGGWGPLALLATLAAAGALLARRRSALRYSVHRPYQSQKTRKRP